MVDFEVTLWMKVKKGKRASKRASQRRKRQSDGKGMRGREGVGERQCKKTRRNESASKRRIEGKNSHRGEQQREISKIELRKESEREREREREERNGMEIWLILK